jgi:hypothetical protein
VKETLLGADAGAGRAAAGPGQAPCLVQHLALAEAQLGEDGLVRRALLHGAADLVKVLGGRQLVVPVRVQQAEVAVQLAPVVARELGADAVERDVQRAPVRLRAARGPLSALRRAAHARGQPGLPLTRGPAPTQHEQHRLTSGDSFGASM